MQTARDERTTPFITALKSAGVTSGEVVRKLGFSEWTVKTVAAPAPVIRYKELKAADLAGNLDIRAIFLALNFLSLQESRAVNEFETERNLKEMDVLLFLFFGQ